MRASPVTALSGVHSSFRVMSTAQSLLLWGHYYSWYSSSLKTPVSENLFKPQRPLVSWDLKLFPSRFSHGLGCNSSAPSFYRRGFLCQLLLNSSGCRCNSLSLRHHNCKVHILAQDDGSRLLNQELDEAFRCTEASINNVQGSRSFGATDFGGRVEINGHRIFLMLMGLVGGLAIILASGGAALASTIATSVLEGEIERRTVENLRTPNFEKAHTEQSILGIAEKKDWTGKLSRVSTKSNALAVGEAGSAQRRMQDTDNLQNSQELPSQTVGQTHALLGCPVKGRTAPLSVLLRFRRGFENTGATFPMAGLGFVREPAGDSMGINYGQIVAAHDDMGLKKDMFTTDAWMGMRRLQQYSRLVDRVEAQEKLCHECTRNRRLLEQIWQTVANEYFDQYGSFSQSQWSGELYRALNKAGGLLRTKGETYRAVKEMVGNLGDRYSAFLTAEQYRLAIHHPIPSELKYLTYQYTGVGMELGEPSPTGGFTIVAPFAGSPAEEAGILGGEQLLAVDDISMNSLQRDEAVALLRGPIGSMVELEVGSQTKARRVLLERRALPLPPLKMQMLNDGHGRLVAYLRLHYFTHEGTNRMAAAIREGEALGVDGYILDLRNNPGGVFEEAIAMAALWLDCKGCDVTETVRSNAPEVEDLIYTVGKLPKDIFLKHPGVLTHAPLAIITNRNSASASEVITGALHDNHRVVTVGEKTFGKGVVQYYFPMDDGSGLKLTVAKYLTPGRYDISKQGGLPPDKACSDYPHGGTQSDKCIEEALGMLTTTERPPGVSVKAPMPYRWLPFTERRFWASGSY